MGAVPLRPHPPCVDGTARWPASPHYPVQLPSRRRPPYRQLGRAGEMGGVMWPQSQETQELLAEARGGDAAAVSRLLDRHRAALRRMIDLRMDQGVRRRVDASDIVQDV